MGTLLLQDTPAETGQTGLIEHPLDNSEEITFEKLIVRHKEPDTLLNRLKCIINKPWAAEYSDVPEIRSPMMTGNSPAPFYAPTTTNKERRQRNEVIRYLKTHQSLEPLSNWSSVFHTTVPIQRLPHDMEGYRLGHLADIHVSIENDRTLQELEHFAEWLCRKENYLDSIVLAGDIIKHHPRDLTPRALDAFALIAEQVPEAYFVLGNHDYYGFQEERIVELMGYAGWQHLHNDTAHEVSGKHFHIHGVDDAIHGTPTVRVPHSPDHFNLLLTHNLDAIRANCPDNFDFILSGHTHWGESRLIQGEMLMKIWDHNDNVNEHTRGWKMLTNRALSYVQPGLERHYVRASYLRIPAGFSIHTFTNAAKALPSWHEVL